MLRRTLCSAFALTPIFRSGGGAGPPAPQGDRSDPMMPWRVQDSNIDTQAAFKGSFMTKLMDQNIPLWDDVCRGRARVEWQEPCKTHHKFQMDETIMLEEHDKEEFNDRPYCTVNHLYEPPIGSESRPMRLEGNGNPGDKNLAMCIGNCAPHVPDGTYLMPMRGYATNQCPMCHQWFYIHNRPWLVMHPDWTDDPASDDGPAYKFSEIEAEFDRDFHEFAIYLNAE